MSDYFLNKIYDSLLSNKPVSKKPVLIKENKKLKNPATLQQAYKLTLTRINEDTEIVMQDVKDGVPHGDVYSEIISDELSRKIKSSIKKEIGYKTVNGKTSLNEIIKNVLTNAGWSKTSRINYLVESVSYIFDKAELNINNFANYSNILQNLKSSPVEENLINKPLTKVELKNLIPNWFRDFFEEGQEYSVVDELWNLIPVTKPASGSGELVLSLISNAKKATEGDLVLNGKIVEIKGTNGIMGADGQVLNTATDLNEIIQEDLAGISMSNRKQQLINVLNKLPFKFNEFKRSIIQQVENNASFEELKRSIDASPLNDNKKEQLYRTIEHTLTIPKSNFRDALLAFFSKYEILSDEQLAAGVFAARNYKAVSSPQEVNNKLMSIIISNKNLFFQKHHERAFTPNMIALIAALHLCCYQEKEKFKGIIFANDVNKSMVYFEFAGDTVEQNLENAYSFILQFNPAISLNMSQMQAAASFAFFK